MKEALLIQSKHDMVRYNQYFVNTAQKQFGEKCQLNPCGTLTYNIMDILTKL